MICSSLGKAGFVALFFFLVVNTAFGFTCHYATEALGGKGGDPWNELFRLKDTRHVFHGYKPADEANEMTSHNGNHMTPPADRQAMEDGAMYEEGEVLKQICIRTGRRVDAISLATNMRNYSYGGLGGHSSCLDLEEGENVTDLGLCTGKKPGSPSIRVVAIAFGTSSGNYIEGGFPSDMCTIFSFPWEYNLIGTYGRSGAEIDKLGFIFQKHC